MLGATCTRTYNFQYQIQFSDYITPGDHKKIVQINDKQKNIDIRGHVGVTFWIWKHIFS